MDPLHFCYWLQGFNELSAKPPGEYQWKIIQDHLKTVFDKKTPVYQPPAGAVGITGLLSANNQLTAIC